MKTNKIIAAALSLCLIGGAVPFSQTDITKLSVMTSYGEDFTSEKQDSFMYFKYSDHAEICGYDKENPPAGDIVVPASIGGLPVTIIRPGTFWDYTDLTSVTLAEGISEIGSSVFSGCTGLKTVNIPASVTSIGDNVFSACDDLTDIKIADGNKNYYDKNGVLFNNGILVKYPVGKQATEYAVPYGTVSIGHGAFYGCENLTSITLPDTVESIGTSAFIGCGITSMTIPDSVTSIEESAFEYCNYLETIKLPKKITSISKNMFNHCTSLMSIKIPDSVTTIEPYAFMKCWSLESVTIPKNVTSIKSSAFLECYCLFAAIENPMCEIGDYKDTFYYETAIHGYEGSTAQAYAEKYERDFVSLGEAPVNYGDVNNDGAINAADASAVLAEYARTSTGYEALFTENQNKSADVNLDGKTDSSDASLILSYYAYTSTGGTKTIEEFLGI